MKKYYLLTAAMLLGIGAYAQGLDLTPDRFKFANQEEGEFLIDRYHAGANVDLSHGLPTTEGADAGFLIVAGGPPMMGGTANAIYDTPPSPLGETLKKYTNIVDLGGEVGKVLAIKGPTSTSEYGPEADSEAAYGWNNYNFYVKASGCEPLQPIRARLVYSIISNEESYDAVFKMSLKTFTNNQGDDQTGWFSPDFFYALDEFGEVAYDDETGLPVYDGSKWCVYEFDYEVSEAAGFPLRLKMDVDGTYGKSACILIKELTFTMNPEGEPIQGEFLTFEPGTGGSSVNDLMSDEKAYRVAGNQVTFFEAGDVYSISGVQVADAVAGETVTLERGIYVVKAGDKAEKLIVK